MDSNSTTFASAHPNVTSVAPRAEKFRLDGPVKSALIRKLEALAMDLVRDEVLKLHPALSQKQIDRLEIVFSYAGTICQEAAARCYRNEGEVRGSKK